jgi:hypothetical protein
MGGAKRASGERSSVLRATPTNAMPPSGRNTGRTWTLAFTSPPAAVMSGMSSTKSVILRLWRKNCRDTRRWSLGGTSEEYGRPICVDGLRPVRYSNAWPSHTTWPASSQQNTVSGAESSSSRRPIGPCEYDPPDPPGLDCGVRSIMNATSEGSRTESDPAPGAGRSVSS